MGGGGKGGSQSTKVEIPKWAESAMRENLNKAAQMSEIGYMPYYGPDVAAFTPMQEAGMQGAYDAAAAFGLAKPGGDAMAGVPEAKDFGGGMMGYSSGDLFDAAVAEFEARNPLQAAAYNKHFVARGVPEEGAGGGGYGPYGGYGGSGGRGPGGYGGMFGGFPNIPNFPQPGTQAFDDMLRQSGIDPSTFTV